MGEYCITEYEGAMEVSKCPECKGIIGGTQHQLVATNGLSRKMDRSTHATWPDTANNMQNYCINVCEYIIRNSKTNEC